MSGYSGRTIKSLDHATGMGTDVIGARPSPVRRWAVRWADAIWLVADVLAGPQAPWRRGRYGIALTWALTRGLTVLLLVTAELSLTITDVQYYAGRIAELGPGTSVAAILREYPTPVVGLLYLPRLLTGNDVDRYVPVFVAMMLAFDAAFTALLARSRTRRQADSLTLWLAAGPVFGALAYTRFDSASAIVSGAALLLLARRPVLAGALTTLGAATKLWPALLIPALAARRPGRWRVVAGMLVTGAVVLALSLVTGGLDRLLSPLTYQSDRGLQIESVPALPLMALWSVFRDPWQVAYSRFLTSEVSGPGAALLVLLANLATLATVVFLLVLWWRAWRRPRLSVAAVGWLSLAATALLIVTNKVLSPQYVLWLLPLAAVAVAVARGPGARRWAAWLMVAGLLTHIEYPHAYLQIAATSWANPLGVLLLAARDAVLLGLAYEACRRAWRTTTPLRTSTSDTGGRRARRP